MNIQLEKLRKEDIKLRANEFCSKYNPNKEIPVPIELIIESKLNIDIVPLADLKGSLDNDGFIAGDFSTIYLDQDVYWNVETRYRFSLAHEIGHYWLHESIFKSLKFRTIDEWKNVYLSIDDKDYNWLEFQANMFAGFILIPDYALEPKFTDLLEKERTTIQTGKNIDQPRDTYLDYVVSYLARKLASFFNVSAKCMQTRIRKDDIYISLIP